MTLNEFWIEVASLENLSNEAKEIAKKYSGRALEAKNAADEKRTADANAVIEAIAKFEGKSFCAKDVAEATGFTSQKASSVLKGMAADGSIVKVEGSANPVEYTVA